MADSELGRAQNRPPRRVLESDCAVVVPASSTIRHHHHHHRHHHDISVGVVRQDVEVSDMDAGGELSITNDQLATADSMTDASDSDHPALSCTDSSFTGRYGCPEEKDHMSPSLVQESCTTANGTPELEIGVGRLQMATNEDELDENGNTYVL